MPIVCIFICVSTYEAGGIGFQDIIFHIEQGDVLGIADHPNQEKYQNQKIMYVGLVERDV